ncbi:MAG: Uma2 family endonuclease [Roseiflexaceae bacterium]
MAAQPKPYYTVEHYLQFERSDHIKHEYFDGQIFALAGSSENHNLISAHILGILYTQVRKRPCKVYPSDMRVKIAKTMLYTYPDISIVCGTSVFDDAESDTLLNPTVIFEILSPSTEKYDRGKKFEHYRAIATLQEYILVSQNSHLIEQYTRQTDNTWLLTVHDAIESRVDLQSVNCMLLLADIYEDIIFDNDESRI